MAVTLSGFTAFFQGEEKSVKRGENHYKSGHVEKAIYGVHTGMCTKKDTTSVVGQVT